MKKLFAVFISVLSLGYVHAEDQVIEDALKKVVELHIKLSDKTPAAKLKTYRTKYGFNKAGEGLCTGAFISPKGHILTARHCMEDAEAVTVEMYNRQNYAARPVRISDVHDLAIIKIDATNTPHFLLSMEIAVGQAVYAIGSPLWISRLVTKGTVAKLDGDITWLDLTILPGNSGGPVIAEDGGLVGIATNYGIFGLGADHLSIMQSMSAILGLLGLTE